MSTETEDDWHADAHAAQAERRARYAASRAAWRARVEAGETFVTPRSAGTLPDAPSTDASDTCEP